MVSAQLHDFTHNFELASILCNTSIKSPNGLKRASSMFSNLPPGCPCCDIMQCQCYALLNMLWRRQPQNSALSQCLLVSQADFPSVFGRSAALSFNEIHSHTSFENCGYPARNPSFCFDVASIYLFRLPFRTSDQSTCSLLPARHILRKHVCLM